MRTDELMLYKHMEHEEVLRDMEFLMCHCEDEYYNKEDLKTHTVRNVRLWEK